MEKEQVEKSFTSSSTPRLEDKIKMIFGKADYLGIADEHSQPESHKFLNSPDIMKAFKESDVRTIYMEALSYDREIMIQAYMDGQISKKALDVYINHRHDISQKNAGTMGEFAIYDIIPDIVEKAKAHNINVRSIDHHEGHVSEKRREPLRAAQKAYAEFILEKISGDNGKNAITRIDLHDYEKEFMAQNPENQELVRTIFRETIERMQEFGIYAAKDLMAGLTKPTAEKTGELRQQLTETLENFLPHSKDILAETAGLSDEQAIKKLIVPYLTLRVQAEGILAKRLNEDHKVGLRIKDDMSKTGGKAVVVYGMAHFLRLKGDIDATLGEDHMAVIRVVKNSGDLEDKSISLPAMDYFNEDISFEDDYDFILDLSDGTWITRDGKRSQVELPESFSPVVNAEKAPPGAEFRTIPQGVKTGITPPEEKVDAKPAPSITGDPG